MHLSNIIAIILGIFEFIACYELWSKKEHKNALLPPDFFAHEPVKMVWMAYILTLGLQRLTWSFGKYRYGDGNLPLFSSVAGYLCLVMTHVVEACLWWSLALSPHFNASGKSAFQIIRSCFDLSVQGGALSAIMLLGVPLLVLFFIIAAFPKRKNHLKFQ